MERKKTKTINKLSYTAIIIVAVFVCITLARPAFADPHAMFYTDKGQEQVFYNFLAALNQADYVEAPPQIDGNGLVTVNNQYGTYPQPTSPPQIDYNTRIGNFLASGTYVPRTGQRTATVNKDAEGNITSVTVGENGAATPLEPLERTNLPHITVRQVTSDNGDAFLRETLQRKALAEQMRVEFAALSCRLMEGLYGPNVVKDLNGNTGDGKNPCDQYVSGDSTVFGNAQ